MDAVIYCKQAMLVPYVVLPSIMISCVAVATQDSNWTEPGLHKLYSFPNQVNCISETIDG